jgi:hypothetical protein
MVAFGLVLRARGYLFSPLALWLDEAAWARRLLEMPLVQHLFRPIGFMAVTKGLVRLLSPSEAVLRFLPWVAGVTATLMAPFLARRLLRSEAARLLFVAILAFDPGSIDLCKEFKPYSVGIALHAGILFLALRYSQLGRARDLAYVSALVFPAALFAQDAVLAYPGVFLLLAFDAVRARRYRHLIATGLVATATAVLVGACYFFMWRHIPKSDDAAWGKKYDIFYVENRSDADESEHDKTMADWLANRYAEMTKIPGERRELWASRRLSRSTLAELRSTYGLIWLTLNLVGLTVIARSRMLRHALLLVLPLVLMAVLNVLGFWPFGPFRANAFVIVYMAGIAAVAVERKAAFVELFDLLPATALVLVPLFAFERGWHRQKEMVSVVGASDYITALKTLISLQGADYTGPPETVIADRWSCDPWRYYTRYNPYVKRTMGRELKRRFKMECRPVAPRILRAMHDYTHRGHRVWVIAGDSHAIEELDRAWPSDLYKTHLARIGGETHVIFGVVATGNQDEPPPPPEVVSPDADDTR